MSNKKKKKLLLILIIFCCCFIAAGYFVLINGLVVKGSLKISPPVWNIRFENIKTIDLTGKARNYNEPQLSAHNIVFYAEFKEVGDSITYDIRIGNRGNLNAKLNDILFIPKDNKYVDCEVIGLAEGEKLKAKNETNVKVKLTYSPKVEVVDQEYKTIKLIFNWIQVD